MTTTIKNATIITNEENAVLDYSTTGNGSKYCFDCGREFITDDKFVTVGQSTSASCQECGGRCANPNVIGVKTVITGTWKNDEVLGTFFLSDDNEEFHFDRTDADGETFFTGISSRPFCVHIGELLDWNEASTYNSISGRMAVGQLVYVRSGFAYSYSDKAGTKPAIVVKEEEGNYVYHRYTCIPIK